MKVTLLKVDDERISALGARVCTEASSITDLQAAADQDRQKNQNILDRVIAMGHDGVLEHTQFSIGIEGVSRALSHQLVRHRIASYLQQSQRYVKSDEVSIVTPGSYQESPELEEKYREFMEAAWELYHESLEEGIPSEDARYVLPNAAQTQLIMTMNGRSLIGFLEERCCSCAQWEIRSMAWKILSLLKSEAPQLFDHVGPKCLRHGYCKESKPKWRGCQLRPHVTEVVLLTKDSLNKRNQALGIEEEISFDNIQFACDTCGNSFKCPSAFDSRTSNGYCIRELLEEE